MTRERRAIRMSDSEWEAFKRLLGPKWLREKINAAIKRDQRKTAEVL
jgi:hypothetical protein